jgi:hypothetical protein
MIATIEKEAMEYAHLLEMLSPDEHIVLVNSISKINIPFNRSPQGCFIRIV